ncbi:unnamed protein product [Prorocentrum cordatum]|uniref:SET domain-containing protein n=1 Tax=Prorocentrum cordatum TaxID=2364126 RepID=A0ABN9X5H2_9DINO|nr:unnamed protein product [Polarella glacialis]
MSLIVPPSFEECATYDCKALLRASLLGEARNGLAMSGARARCPGMVHEGPPAAGVAHINEHGREHFAGCLECQWTEDRGRVLYARRGWKRGDVILREAPLHVVQQEEGCAAYRRLVQLCKKHEADFDYEPLWYWCALQSLTAAELEGACEGGWAGASEATQTNLLLLHHEEVVSPRSAATILAREMAPAASPITIERLTQIWVLNCFEYSDEPEGYSTYFFSSFMSHSCCPNAVWHYTGVDHVLRARRDVQEPPLRRVCISYLAEHMLLQSAPVRRMELHRSKRFWCACERCRAGGVDFSRGLWCPACRQGAVYACTPASGPAQDAVLRAAQLLGSRCDKCGHAVTTKEADDLAALERRLQAVVEEYTQLVETRGGQRPTIAQLKATEDFIHRGFAQHVLADLAWEQMAALHPLRADRCRLLRLRCDFYRDAYPGLHGAHAWALEALADVLATEAAGGGGVAARLAAPSPEDAADARPSSQHSKSLSPALRRAYSSKKRFPVLGGSDSFGAQERSADKVRQFHRGGLSSACPSPSLVKSMGRRCKALQRVKGKDFEASARAALGLRLERERQPLGPRADLRAARRGRLVLATRRDAGSALLAGRRSAAQTKFDNSIEALPFPRRALQRVPVAILTPLVKSMGRRCKALQRVKGKDFEAGARAALGLRLERERPPLGRAADLRGLGAAGSAWAMLARGLLRAAGGDRHRATFGTKPGQCPAQPRVRLAMRSQRGPRMSSSRPTIGLARARRDAGSALLAGRSPSSQHSKSLSPALRRAYSSKKRFPVLGGSDSFGAQERSADQVRQSIEALPFSEAILTPLVKSMGRRCKALQRVKGKDFEAGARAALGLRLERERPPLGRAADLRGLGAAGPAPPINHIYVYKVGRPCNV